jgi:hypothetical protein
MSLAAADEVDTGKKIGRFSLERARLEITLFFFFYRIDSLRRLESKRRFKQIISLPPLHLISFTVIRVALDISSLVLLLCLRDVLKHYKQKAFMRSEIFTAVKVRTFMWL